MSAASYVFHAFDASYFSSADWPAEAALAPTLREPLASVGTYAPSLRGTALRRFVSSYAPWMVQRTLNAYRALAEPERAAVDAAIAGTGWEEPLAYEPRHRFTKKGFALAFA